MHRSSRYSFLSLALLTIFGSSAVQAQPLPERIPLVGEVRDQGGNPLLGVVLSIRRQDDAGAYAFWGSETSTDARGRFLFPDAEEGRYYLNAEKSGYAQLLNQSVTWGAKMEPLRLRLERLARLKLRILQPDGSALKNSFVQFRLRGEPGVGQLYRRLMTDGNGQVILDALPPAQYSIFLVASGVGNASLNNIEGKYAADPTAIEAPLLPGGTVRVRAVEKVADGAPGKPLGGAQIVLVPSNISDTIVDNPQAVDPNENIALLTTQTDRSALVTKDGDGTVTLNDLPVGRYYARIIIPGWPNPPIKTVEVTASGTTDVEWDISARASGSLTLNVRSSDGQPAATQDITVRAMPLGPQSGDEEPVPMDIPGGIAPGAPGGVRRGTTDESGKLTLYPLRAGRYRLWVSVPTGRGPERRNAIAVEAQATVAGGSVDITLPQTPAKP